MATRRHDGATDAHHASATRPHGIATRPARPGVNGRFTARLQAVAASGQQMWPRAARPVMGTHLDASLVLLDSASKAMQRVIATARQAAASDVPVLLLGEIGTGRSALAGAIHSWSPRRDAPFITLSGTAARSGPPSNARGGRAAGRSASSTYLSKQVRAASHGTLFVEAIGDLSLDLQADLLRLLGDHRVTQTENGEPESADVRIVTASNHDLEAEVR